MALAVGFTNTGLQRDACHALHRWICHNPRYKHLLLDSTGPPPGPAPSPSHAPSPAAARYSVVDVCVWRVYACRNDTCWPVETLTLIKNCTNSM